MQKISKQKIKDIYAEALLKGTHPADKVTKIVEQTEILNRFLQEDESICEYFSSPLYSLSDKISALREISDKIKLDKELFRFLQIIIENNRFSAIAEILESFKEMYIKSQGYTLITVQTVKELSKKQDSRLQKNLEDLLSTKVIIKYDIKPEILGGLCIIYDSNIIDDTLKNKINRLQKIMKGA